MPSPLHRLLTALSFPLLCALMLSACTTYTWEDGQRETVWGVPADDETLTEDERQNRAVKYREPGEIPDKR